MDMRTKKYRIFACDFETTVYDDQTFTEVWASAISELYTEDVVIFNDIASTFDYLFSLKENLILYYHNLKFDGSFILDYFLTKLKWKQAYTVIKDEPFTCKWKEERFMDRKSLKYMISNKGQWYTIILRTPQGKFIEIRDSLKLLPFSLRAIGKSFKTKHQKLEIEYKGLRFAGCRITEEEKEYIRNDVLVLNEALQIMYNDGHNKLTIGSCCLAEFKATYDKEYYNAMFPQLYDIELDPAIHTYTTAGKWLLKSYKGGWCYLVKGKQGKIFHNGLTADVNSLYPSMMHSQSGNRYPVGKPTFWVGNYIPDIAKKHYYFVRIRTRFYLKSGYLPFIQIKGNLLYVGNECLETSDIYDPINDTYYQTEDSRVVLTLTMTDYELIKEHYYLTDFEIIDGCWFYERIGIFDEYIDKYMLIKMNTKGAKRTEAKLFLNNLYGKLASSTDSSFKVAYINEQGSLSFSTVIENDKEGGYIACGSAITSYSRNFTIRTAQKNYHGDNAPGFVYADTDSIHCNDTSKEDLVDVPVHQTNLCHWKLEAYWNEAIFTRQKTYVEHVTHEDEELIDKPYYSVKCAGMPDTCKNEFIKSIEDNERTLSDFTIGLTLHGKLMPKRIPGGIVLKESNYVMR